MWGDIIADGQEGENSRLDFFANSGINFFHLSPPLLQIHPTRYHLAVPEEGGHDEFIATPTPSGTFPNLPNSANKISLDVVFVPILSRYLQLLKVFSIGLVWGVF